ncbi:ccr4 associated factor [Coemansia interrupta]|uniref:Ccr4 associated factor n=1 Tax=Coemansia interrupta TaxID=1126814 RepID=A0A9W8HJD3_9FUNG|nr:ccr4 associated factor [Coemansia interrupta]
MHSAALCNVAGVLLHRQLSGALRRRIPVSARRLYSSMDGQSSVLKVQDVRGFETLLDKTDQYARLGGRAVLEVSGRDASEFLQGMQCNNMPSIDQGGPGMLTGFLVPQGRVLADAFIYPKNAGVNFPHPVFLIEIDTRAKDRLLKTLRFYKLRSQLSIRDVTEEYGVWGVWGPGSGALVGSQGQPISHVPRGSLVFKGETSAAACVWLNDTRAPGMGLRLLLPKYQSPVLPGSFDERPSDMYRLRRILKGVPEGSDDFVADVSVPLECNMDYMHGVHFNKGCYVGQELTIRTHHRGVVRKRIVPVIYSAPELNPGGANPLLIDRMFSQTRLPAPQADIVRVAEEQAAADSEHRPGRARKVPPGKTASGVFNAGLALMRLEHVEQYVARGDGPGAVMFETVGADGGRLLVSPWSPGWWPSAS